MGSRRRFLKAVGIGTVASALPSHVSATEDERATRPPNPPVERKNIKAVGYHDLEKRPGFKMGISKIDGRWYLFIGMLFTPGWTILDVTDPKRPQFENFIEGPPNTWTLQMQAIDGLLVTNAEQPATGWQPAEDLRSSTNPGFPNPDDHEGGVIIMDARDDPANPEHLSFYEIEHGTHRNHYDGSDYAYLAAQPEGFEEKILVILDVSDPENPVEVGRQWWPGQHEDEDLLPGDEEHGMGGLHGPPYPDSGEDPEHAVLSYGQFGMVTADISDPENPEFVHRMDFGHVGNTGSSVANHTVVYHPGTDIAWTSSEAIAEGHDEEWTYVFALDKEDPESDFVLGPLPTPTPERKTNLSNYYDKGGRFGPHNTNHYQYHEDYYDPSTTDIQAWAWFNAGVRLFDVSDPRAPNEVGYFVPDDPEERWSTVPDDDVVQTEDVLVDSRGYIYITHKNQGLYILESNLL